MCNQASPSKILTKKKILIKIKILYYKIRIQMIGYESTWMGRNTTQIQQSNTRSPKMELLCSDWLCAVTAVKLDSFGFPNVKQYNWDVINWLIWRLKLKTIIKMESTFKVRKLMSSQTRMTIKIIYTQIQMKLLGKGANK